MSCFACVGFICCSRFGHGAARLSISSPGSGAGRGLARPGPGRLRSRIGPGSGSGAGCSAPSRMTPRGKSSPRPLSRGLVRLARRCPARAPSSAAGQHRRQLGESVAVIVSPAPTGSGSLFRAYPARARARVGAGAARAPDCAREAEGAPLPSASYGFSEMAPPGRAAPGEAAPDFASLGTIIPHSARCQAYIGNKINKYRKLFILRKIGRPTSLPAFPPAETVVDGPRIGSGATKWGALRALFDPDWGHSRRHHSPFGASAMTRRGG